MHLIEPNSCLQFSFWTIPEVASMFRIVFLWILAVPINHYKNLIYFEIRKRFFGNYSVFVWIEEWERFDLES